MATRFLNVLVLAVALLGALNGCATFKKCGFSGCPGDAQITAEVQARIDNRPALSGDDISVQTLEHVVYLHGLVDTGMEQSIAEEIALSVPGVVRVVSSIAVRGNAW